MQKTPLLEYLKSLASESPAPGGGAVAALTGAQAAALIAMVIRISRPGGCEKWQKRLEILDNIVAQLCELAEEDGRSFLSVIEAYRLPKESEDQRKKRNRSIQSALKVAADTPLLIMRKTASLREHVAAVQEIAKKSIVSDLEIAAMLIETALKAASHNVAINADSLEDNSLAKTYHLEIRDLLRNGSHEKYANPKPTPVS